MLWWAWMCLAPSVARSQQLNVFGGNQLPDAHLRFHQQGRPEMLNMLSVQTPPGTAPPLAQVGSTSHDSRGMVNQKDMRNTFLSGEPSDADPEGEKPHPMDVWQEKFDKKYKWVERGRWWGFKHQDFLNGALWPKQMQHHHITNILMRSADYMYYDQYVDMLEYTQDLYRGVGNFAAMSTAAAFGHVPEVKNYGNRMVVRGPLDFIYRWRIRASFALQRTEFNTDDGDVYHTHCMSTPTFAVGTYHTSGSPYLELGCDDFNACHECIRLWYEAGKGGVTGMAAYGQTDNCFPERWAMSSVVIRAWLCEEMKKKSIGLARYWLERTALWKFDNGKAQVAESLTDVRSEVMTGALQACADMNREKIMGNFHGDGYHSEDSSAWATNCVWVQNALQPHKHTLMDSVHKCMKFQGKPPLSWEEHKDKDAEDVVPLRCYLMAVQDWTIALHREGKHENGYTCGSAALGNMHIRFPWVRWFPHHNFCGRRGDSYETAVEKDGKAIMETPWNKFGGLSQIAYHFTDILHRLTAAKVKPDILDPLEAAMKRFQAANLNAAYWSIESYEECTDVYIEAIKAASKVGDGIKLEVPDYVKGEGVLTWSAKEVLVKYVATAVLRGAVWNMNWVIDLCMYVHSEVISMNRGDASDVDVTVGGDLNEGSDTSEVCDTVVTCHGQLARFAAFFAAWIPQFANDPATKVEDLMVLVKQMACMAHCIYDSTGDVYTFGRQNPFLHFYRIFNSTYSMFDHYERMRDNDPELEKYLGELYSDYVVTDDLRRISRLKAENFLKLQTADLAPNTQLRKMEEIFIHFNGITEVYSAEAAGMSTRYFGEGGYISLIEYLGCKCYNTTDGETGSILGRGMGSIVPSVQADTEELLAKSVKMWKAAPQLKIPIDLLRKKHH